MCETDFVLAVLVLLGPLWLGERAVVDSSLRLCHSFLESVRRGVVATSPKDPAVAQEGDLTQRRGGDKASMARGDEVSARSSRLKKLVRIRSPPIELRRGFRRPRPLRLGSDVHSSSIPDRDSSTLLSSFPPMSPTKAPAPQPSLGGCRRAVASSLLQSRPNTVARRRSHTSSTVRTSASTASAFMASFKVTE